MSAELVERWDAFLARIEARQLEILEEARDGLLELIAADPSDLPAVDRALTAIEHVLRGVWERIDDVWSDSVSDQFSEASAGDAPTLEDRGADRAQDVEQGLREDFARFSLAWRMYAYRQLWPAVEVALAQEVPCTQCGRPLDVARRDRTESVTCGGCGAVNQVMADAIVQTYRGSAHTYAEATAIGKRHAIERRRIEVDRDLRNRGWPQESIASLDEWEALERGYWETYADAFRRYGGTTRKGAADLVASRTKGFREQVLMMTPHWRRAKGV